MIGRGSQPKFRSGGYTIVEVMIFLVVSAALFAMIAGTFSRRQARAEFATAARDMESRLQDLANNVSSGVYDNPGDFNCSVNASGLVRLDPGTNTQGTNAQCIFVGNAAQFDLQNTGGRQYNVYNVVGARQSAGEDVTSMAQARPRVLNLPGHVSTLQFPVGLVLKSMYSSNGATNTPVSTVGFFTQLESVGGDPSSLGVDVVPFGIADNSSTQAIQAIQDTANYAAARRNPRGGVILCFEGDAAEQYAVITLGGSQNALATDVKIGDGSCTDAGYPTT